MITSKQIPPVLIAMAFCTVALALWLNADALKDSMWVTVESGRIVAKAAGWQILAQSWKLMLLPLLIGTAAGIVLCWGTISAEEDKTRRLETRSADQRKKLEQATSEQKSEAAYLRQMRYDLAALQADLERKTSELDEQRAYLDALKIKIEGDAVDLQLRTKNFEATQRRKSSQRNKPKSEPVLIPKL